MDFHNDFYSIKKLVYDPCKFELSSLFLEEESSDYGACSFKLDKLFIRFRAAKITPTKAGQFVTLWKRKKDGPIEPFESSDDIDFFVVSVRTKKRFGHFVFSKSALCLHGVLTHKGKEGKRALRVYPPWDKVTSKQALKTQAWQSEFFVEIFEDQNIDTDSVKTFYNLS